MSDLLTLDDALNQLQNFSPRLAQVVEYKYFGSLTFEEIAQVEERSTRTVRRDWEKARMLLYKHMTEASSETTS
jgi:DNA-directed RNA polymerase specialized sigma24 family protein